MAACQAKPGPARWSCWMTPVRSKREKARYRLPSRQGLQAFMLSTDGRGD